MNSSSKFDPHIHEFLSVIDETNTPNLERIVTISDIHGDIMPLIVQLRDCAKLIKKKLSSTKKYELLPKGMYQKRTKELERQTSPELMSPEFIQNDALLSLDIDDDRYDDDLGYEWIGQHVVLVIVGDIIDTYRDDAVIDPERIENGVKSVGTLKGGKFVYDAVPKFRYGEYDHEEIRIIRFLHQLQIQALKKESRIILLAGNHETMNNTEGLGGQRYISPGTINMTYKDKYIDENGNINEKLVARKDLFLPGKYGCRLLTRQNNFGLMVRVFDYVFVHGGFNSKTSSTLMSIDELNKLFLYFFTGQDKKRKSPPSNERLKLEDDYKDIIMSSLNGITWNRDLAEVDVINGYHRKNEEYDKYCAKIYHIIENLCDKSLKTNSQWDTTCSKNLRIVVGHCQQTVIHSTDSFNSAFGKLLNVDKNVEIYTAPVIVGITDKVRSVITDGQDTAIYFGMSMECGRPGKYHPELNHPDDPAIYRVDHSTSRAFDNQSNNTIIEKRLIPQKNYDDAVKFLEAYFVRNVPQVLNIKLKGENQIVKSSVFNTVKNVPRNYPENVRNLIEEFIRNESYEKASPLLTFERRKQINDNDNEDERDELIRRLISKINEYRERFE